MSFIDLMQRIDFTYNRTAQANMTDYCYEEFEIYQAINAVAPR